MNDSLALSTKSALILRPSLRTAARVALSALLLATAASGCATTTSEEIAKPVATEQAAETAEATAPEHQGVGGVFAAAASKLDLTPQQKQTVDAIKADMQAKSAPVKEAKEAFRAALADGVSRGTIDKQALATPLANLTRAAEAAKPALQDAMNRLHAALNADQRAKLVDLMAQRGEDRKERKHDEGGGMRGKMKKMAAELELTDDQIKTIKTNLRAEHKEQEKEHEGDRAAMEAKHGDHAAMDGKREEMRARMQKLGEAFKGEAFDAKALDIGKEMPVMATRMAEMTEHFLAIVTPTLTAPQRVKAAAMIQKHGAMMEKAAPGDVEE